MNWSDEAEEILLGLRDYYSDESQLEDELVFELVQIGCDPEQALAIALDLVR